jgi:DNA polymerase-3 subunit alpha
VDDVFWDRVASIEPRGEQPTFDLTVEIDHNFVADGLIVHNSHAFCYALLAYQTAYFKANYPAEWFAAVLSTIAADTDKVVGVVGECRRMDVPLLPPDINASELQFRVESNGIRFGLAAVKNVGEGAVEQIVRERDSGGAYTTLEEFCRRQDLHTVNKRVIESLIKCGAMDCLGPREALLDAKRLDSAIAAAQIDQKAASTGQVSLFDMFGGADTLTPATVAADLVANGTAAAPPPQSRERALWEKEVLGFQFGDHPYMEAAAWLANTVTHDASQLTAELSGEKVKIAGLVTGVRRIMTKTKSQMAIVQLEDLHGTIEAVVFPRIYERNAALFRDDAILVIDGKVDSRSDRDRPQIVVDRVEEFIVPPKDTPPPPPIVSRAKSESPPMSRNGATRAADIASVDTVGHQAVQSAPPPEPEALESRRVLRVIVPRGEDDNACVRLLEQLHIIVVQSPGSDQVQLVLHDRAGGRIELAGADILVRHSADLESQVRTLVGADNLELLSP